jgi:hypothetical protein
MALTCEPTGSRWVWTVDIRGTTLETIKHVTSQAALDDYGTIKCINFIRIEVRDGRDPLPALTAAVGQTDKPWDDDKYLQPVLEDDGLLFHDFDDEDNERCLSASASHTLDSLCKHSSMAVCLSDLTPVHWC